MYLYAMQRAQAVAILFLTLWNTGSGWQQSKQYPSAAESEHPENKKLDKDSLHSVQAFRRLSHPIPTSSLSFDPFIDPSLSSGNVTVLVGKQVILACFIANLGNQSVSWIRHSDSGLLAVNDFVYTSSHRVKVFHDNGSSEWKLSINPVQVEDHGLYECQVSTTPHTSHFMAITVIEPKTMIVGNDELFIEAGSTINLTCIILTGPSTETHIYWNYNGKIITYDRSRGGTIVIDKRDGQTVTSLIISHAETSDSGTYTCNPASPFAKKVIVHVTTGPNAMVRSGAGWMRISPMCFIIYLWIKAYVQ